MQYWTLVLYARLPARGGRIVRSRARSNMGLELTECEPADKVRQKRSGVDQIAARGSRFSSLNSHRSDQEGQGPIHQTR